MEKTIDVAFENIRYCYGEVCAVNGVSFSLTEKSSLVLVGPNGGGKSTLIKLITGLMKPDEGSISFRKGLEIGYVPQDFTFDTSFPLTVEELVLQGTLPRSIQPFRRYSAAQKEKARHALVHAGLHGCENRGINHLSGGQLKRAVIARVFASDATLIALDEPDASLDVDAANELFAMLGAMKKDKTIVIASHNIESSLQIADQALYINQTARVYETPGELRDRLKGGISL